MYFAHMIEIRDSRRLTTCENLLDDADPGETGVLSFQRSGVPELLMAHDVLL